MISAAATPHAFAARGPEVGAAFAAIERRVGGRLGVCVLDTGAGRRLLRRADERFPMCSTFKWLAAAAVLARVDKGVERLDRHIPFTQADMLPTSPATTPRLAEGSAPLGELCAAIIAYSDNTAANLVLKTLGGPTGLTAWVGSTGDGVTRLDRSEMTLNSAIPGDPRDTTTPAAMVADLGRIMLGDALSPRSRAQLADWMVGCKTGEARLRAGLPKGVRMGDKTGTGAHGTANDLAVIWPPSRAPILIAAYLTGADQATDAQRDAALADVGRIATTVLELSA